MKVNNSRQLQKIQSRIKDTCCWINNSTLVVTVRKIHLMIMYLYCFNSWTTNSRVVIKVDRFAVGLFGGLSKSCTGSVSQFASITFLNLPVSLSVLYLKVFNIQSGIFFTKCHTYLPSLTLSQVIQNTEIQMKATLECNPLYKVLHTTTAPQYLKDILTSYQPRRTLRSASDQ